MISSCWTARGGKCRSGQANGGNNHQAEVALWHDYMGLFARHGKDSADTRIRPQVMGFERRADAESALNEALAKLQAGNVIRPSLKTFEEHIEAWLTHREQSGRCNPKTIERYREDLERYVLPALKDTPLQKVTVYSLEALYAKLRSAGGKDGRPLAPKTVRNIASMVHAALTSALKWKLIPSNPADACDLPSLDQREQRALDKAETEKLLTQAHDDRIYPLLYFAVATGMRRGELLALTWPDVDMLAHTVRISKSLLQTRAGLSVKSTKNNRPRQMTFRIAQSRSYGFIEASRRSRGRSLAMTIERIWI